MELDSVFLRRLRHTWRQELPERLLEWSGGKMVFAAVRLEFLGLLVLRIRDVQLHHGLELSVLLRVQRPNLLRTRGGHRLHTIVTTGLLILLHKWTYTLPFVLFKRPSVYLRRRVGHATRGPDES